MNNAYIVICIQLLLLLPCVKLILHAYQIMNVICLFSSEMLQTEDCLSVIYLF